MYFSTNKIILDLDKIIKLWWMFLIWVKIFSLGQLFWWGPNFYILTNFLLSPTKKFIEQFSFTLTNKKYRYKKWLRFAPRWERVTVFFYSYANGQTRLFYQLNEKGVISHIKSLRPKKLAPIAYILFKLRLFTSS